MQARNTRSLIIAVAATLGLGAGPVMAANNGNHGNSGLHGNSGSHGNSGPENASVISASVQESTARTGGGSTNAHHGKITALAGGGNAAHASVQGLLHASPNSAVGRVRAYADANFKAQQLDKATMAALTACNAALGGDSSTSSLGLNCSTTDVATLTAAGASAETLQAFSDYQDAKVASNTADATAQTALGGVTKSADNSQVKAYIDGLLSKYYSYLKAQ